jgi:hypothetical protein
MPKITVEFSSFEEFMAFRGGAAVEAPKTETVAEADKPKRTRVKKDEPVIVPEPEQPPAVIETAAPAFPVVTEQPANPFPVQAESTPVEKLVARINKRIDDVIAQGQPEDKMVAWFRTQVGPEGANANLSQIKQALLPKLSETQLEGIAKLIGAA